jgi:hypothetical protein
MRVLETRVERRVSSSLTSRTKWFRYTEELKWVIRTVKIYPEENNIKTLYMKSQKFRLLEKTKRLGKDHKLSKRIKGA